MISDTVKVADLAGAVLDEWVARAMGRRVELRKRSPLPKPIMVLVEDNGESTRGIPHYSTSWAAGGPIIEQNKFDLTESDGTWCAYDGENGLQYGPTPLIAVMRAYVASKFGDEVAAAKQEAP